MVLKCTKCGWSGMHLDPTPGPNNFATCPKCGAEFYGINARRERMYHLFDDHAQVISNACKECDDLIDGEEPHCGKGFLLPIVDVSFGTCKKVLQYRKCDDG